MNTIALPIQELTFQLKELDIQIDLLNNEKTATELKVMEYSKELASLRAKRHDITHDLNRLETPGYSMWENIRDGG